MRFSERDVNGRRRRHGRGETRARELELHREWRPLSGHGANQLDDEWPARRWRGDGGKSHDFHAILPRAVRGRRLP